MNNAKMRVHQVDWSVARLGYKGNRTVLFWFSGGGWVVPFQNFQVLRGGFF